MSELIMRELPQLAHRPSVEDVLVRIRGREPVPGAPAADLIAAERDRH